MSVLQNNAYNNLQEHCLWKVFEQIQNGGRIDAKFHWQSFKIWQWQWRWQCQQQSGNACTHAYLFTFGGTCVLESDTRIVNGGECSLSNEDSDSLAKATRQPAGCLLFSVTIENFTIREFVQKLCFCKETRRNLFFHFFVFLIIQQNNKKR